METSEQKFQLRCCESRGRAATEVDGFRRERKARALLIEIAQYCFTKSPCLRAIEQIFVKRAVRANTRAKRDVNVDVADHVHFPHVIPSGARSLASGVGSHFLLNVQVFVGAVLRFAQDDARWTVVIRPVTHKIGHRLLSFRAEAGNPWVITFRDVSSLLDMTELRNVALILFCAIASSLAQTPLPAPTPSIVYSVHDPGSIKDYKTNPRIVREMVNRLVLAATGQSDLGKAWGSLVSPNDRIGIKISAAGGELFTTHHDIVNAIVDGLVASGHPRSSIVVWDRSLGGIKDAGYRPAVDGYQVKAIAPHDGYDAKAMQSAPLVGQLIWGDLDYLGNARKMLSDIDNTSNVSHFSKILSSEVSKIINVPVMSISETNGIAGCIYNVTIPNIDNWRRFAQGPRFGAESLAEIYANPLIAKKVVFNLMDGLVGQYAGGPQPQPNYALHHATLYASRDPVALDAIALKRLEEWRKRGSLRPVGSVAAYIDFASQLGLGNSATNRIEVRNIGR